MLRAASARRRGDRSAPLSALRSLWDSAREAARGRTSRSSSWALVGQTAALLASLGNFVLLARLLGPAEYGEVAAAWALVLIVAPVAALGSHRLVIRDVSSDGRPPAAALGAGLMTNLLGSVVAAAALLLLLPVLLPQVPRTLVAALVVADVLAAGASACLTSLCFSTERARSAAVVATGVNAAKLTAVLVFAVVDGDNPVVWALLYAGFAAGSTVLQLAWAVRTFGRVTVQDYRLRTRVAQGFPFSVGFAASLLQKDVDKPLLVRAGYAEEAGVYSVAYRLASIVLLPVLAVQQVFYPRFFEAGSRDGLRGSSALARKVAVPLLSYAAVAGVLLVLVAPLVPLVIGEEYREAATVLALLAPLPLLRVAQSVPGDGLTGAGREGTRTACVVVSAGVNLALNLVLIPRYGLPAALVTTFVSEVLLAVLVLVALRRVTRNA